MDSFLFPFFVLFCVFLFITIIPYRHHSHQTTVDIQKITVLHKGDELVKIGQPTEIQHGMLNESSQSQPTASSSSTRTHTRTPMNRLASSQSATQSTNASAVSASVESINISDLMTKPMAVWTRIKTQWQLKLTVVAKRVETNYAHITFVDGLNERIRGTFSKSPS